MLLLNVKNIKNQNNENFVVNFQDTDVDSDSDTGNSLAANLLLEKLSRHRVRHLQEKLDKIDENDPVVQAILSKFCFEPR